MLRLRVPRGTGVDRIALRYTDDGEARFAVAERDGEDGADEWWTARFAVQNPVVSYRWLLGGGEVGYAWVNGLGVVTHDVPDADDFVLSVRRPAPDWHLESVVYEIFPDRFARGGVDAAAPAWAIERAWDEPVEAGRDTASREWYGGDLRGIAQRLGHVEALGANVIYLTPIFPAGSTHRYDAHALDRVDPLLGGDAALDELVRAAHGRGMRVVADLTTNHVGIGHEWFRAAQADAHAAERDYFLFDDAIPHGYAAWWGIPTLPKLNWLSPELRERMLEIVRSWLERGLDGWRIDVANMTGRHGAIDVNVEVARAVREAGGRRPRRRRARARLPRRPRRGRLGRDDELLRLPAPRLVVAAGRDAPREAARELLVDAGRAAAAHGRRRRRDDARLPRRRPVAGRPALLGAPRQPRRRPLPHGLGLARAPPRRARPADDDAGRADGLRRRRARARGRLGRGRAPDDAVGPARAVGPRPARGLPRGSSRCGGRATRSRAAASATRTSRTTRSRTCARPRASGCSASPPGTTRRRSRCRSRRSGRRRWRPSRAATPSSSGGTALLPGDGPAFHVWRLL